MWRREKRGVNICSFKALGHRSNLSTVQCQYTKSERTEYSALTLWSSLSYNTSFPYDNTIFVYIHWPSHRRFVQKANRLRLEEKRCLTKAFLSLSFSSPAAQDISNLHLPIRVQGKHTQADLQSRYALNHRSAQSHSHIAASIPQPKSQNILKVFSAHGLVAVIPVKAFVAALRRFLARIVELALGFAARIADCQSKAIHRDSQSARQLPFKGILRLLVPGTFLGRLRFWRHLVAGVLYDECRWLRRMLKKPEEYRQQLNFAALTSIVPLRYVILLSAEALGEISRRLSWYTRINYNSWVLEAKNLFYVQENQLNAGNNSYMLISTSRSHKGSCCSCLPTASCSTYTTISKSSPARY